MEVTGLSAMIASLALSMGLMSFLNRADEARVPSLPLLPIRTGKLAGRKDGSVNAGDIAVTDKGEVADTDCKVFGPDAVTSAIADVRCRFLLDRACLPTYNCVQNTAVRSKKSAS